MPTKHGDRKPARYGQLSERRCGHDHDASGPRQIRPAAGWQPLNCRIPTLNSIGAPERPGTVLSSDIGSVTIPNHEKFPRLFEATTYSFVLHCRHIALFYRVCADHYEP
jgi:hypothetical protein